MNLYVLEVDTPQVRTKIRQEFERNRNVQQLPVVDMLISKSNMEFQETMNYWKQITQIMKYFRVEEDPRAHVPKDFMTGFLEVGWMFTWGLYRAKRSYRDVTRSFFDTSVCRGSLNIMSVGCRIRLLSFFLRRDSVYFRIAERQIPM